MWRACTASLWQVSRRPPCTRASTGEKRQACTDQPGRQGRCGPGPSPHNCPPPGPRILAAPAPAGNCATAPLKLVITAASQGAAVRAKINSELMYEEMGLAVGGALLHWVGGAGHGGGGTERSSWAALRCGHRRAGVWLGQAHAAVCSACADAAPLCSRQLRLARWPADLFHALFMWGGPSEAGLRCTMPWLLPPSSHAAGWDPLPGRRTAADTAGAAHGGPGAGQQLTLPRRTRGRLGWIRTVHKQEGSCCYILLAFRTCNCCIKPALRKGKHITHGQDLHEALRCLDLGKNNVHLLHKRQTSYAAVSRRWLQVSVCKAHGR